MQDAVPEGTLSRAGDRAASPYTEGWAWDGDSDRAPLIPVLHGTGCAPAVPPREMLPWEGGYTASAACRDSHVSLLTRIAVPSLPFYFFFPRRCEATGAEGRLHHTHQRCRTGEFREIKPEDRSRAVESRRSLRAAGKEGKCHFRSL